VLLRRALEIVLSSKKIFLASSRFFVIFPKKIEEYLKNEIGFGSEILGELVSKFWS